MPELVSLPPLAKISFEPMTQLVKGSCFRRASGGDWYPPVMINATAIGARMSEGPHYVEEAIRLYERLSPDEYVVYLLDYYREGLRRFGRTWRYADIVTALLATTDLLQPESYLEIGVRCGRSVCAVASRAPDVDLHLFDMWKNKNYAGMENPGPEFVADELKRLGHRGTVEFHIGNSHQTLKAFFAQNPTQAFDLITVDGDHTYAGAAEDISDVVPHLKVGGALVFDDICHPKHLHLREVWSQLLEEDARFSTLSIDDIGYGIGVAIRLW